MEQNFQTSFIPKKPIVEPVPYTNRTSVNLLLAISIIIFIAVGLVSGVAYFYKNILGQNVNKMKNDLDLAQSSFEPSMISQLKLLDKRLQYSSEVLANHISISPIFDIL